MLSCRHYISPPCSTLNHGTCQRCIDIRGNDVTKRRRKCSRRCVLMCAKKKNWVDMRDMLKQLKASVSCCPLADSAEPIQPSLTRPPLQNVKEVELCRELVVEQRPNEVKSGV